LPLLERARVEVYLPDLPRAAYYNLLDELTQEFTYTFGGISHEKASSRSEPLIRARSSIIIAPEFKYEE
jgi:hypothetical protein